MDPVTVGLLLVCALVALSGVSVARCTRGKWTVKRVIMGVPVEWEASGQRATDDSYTAWSITLGGAPWPWNKGRK